MAEGDVQSVLRCEQCNKPFDKESTLKRHGYYCRSRRAAGTTRSRSCLSCAKRKARCDNRRPRCSRCITKNTECHFPANTPKGKGPNIQHGNDGLAERMNITSSLGIDPFSLEDRQEVSNDTGTTVDNTFAISDPEFADIGGEYFDWHDPELNFDGFLDPPIYDQTVQYLPSGSSSLIRHSRPLTSQTVQSQQRISASNLSIPPIPTVTIRSLLQRPKIETGAQRIANLMLHTLKSFPLMMLRYNTLPPFIHPGLISSNSEDNHMEPLINCINLVNMIRSGIQGSRKLFWKNVRLECERLCEEHQRLNKWELLAGMQALSIYVLIRLDEGETDHNNFDFLILTTVTIIAKQLSRTHITCGAQSVLYNHGPQSKWKDWIFEESRRRLSVLYRVVNMLVYFEPAAMCQLQKDLVLAPLPSKKQLWEAGDELLWKVEGERELGTRNDFGLAATGELVKLDDGQIYCGDSTLIYKSLDTRAHPRSPANWEDWCSGMDGFGGLVMLAASLVV